MSNPSSTDMQVFEFDEDTAIRVLGTHDDPLFVLSDIARAVGHTNPAVLAKRLDPEGVSQAYTPTNGGPQLVTVVTESGLYEAVLRSDKPEAVPFRRWVTGTVLPEIRRTGSFGTRHPHIDGNSITRMELITLAMNAETERLALEAKNAELEPKAEAYDSFVDTTGKYSVGAVAKMLGSSQNKLFRDLRNSGVLISKGAMRNTPYQQYMRYFEVKAHEYERNSGELGCSYTTYVQPAGIDFIRRKLGLPAIDPVLSPAVDGEVTA